ncbi:sulfurtransferase [Tenacibaculum sp. S7007]|uniref:Sulfurtransferase n=1 Tax=Tenacibaculum pelagium TaxID=2759527 RepID=A0A839APM3_9FLAO|nr:sulfurtransferase [Tenacibaculum pelagium]MBA6157032.1 sulfurtransferase [Tenacibaculum pelagium]
MKLSITNPLVSANWLYENLNAENLIVLDATIAKVGTKNDIKKEKQQITNAVFFDLKNVFLDKEGTFPNTIPEASYFEKEAQKLGVNQDSCIVVYDDLGVYSSPRVWWLFKTFGFKNVAVLNGGLPAWNQLNYPTEIPKKRNLNLGNFKANYQSEKVSSSQEVLNASMNDNCILDARSEGRFYATAPEPRADLRGGHIPNSKSLPYSELQTDGEMKTKKELQELFLKINPNNEEVIFSCGSGITACILALGSEVAGNTNYKVYDGSWTAWASNLENPIEK